MLTEIRIYFEGDKSLKPGFDIFFRDLSIRAYKQSCRLRCIATGGKPEQDFGIALRTHPTAWNILLRDSEGPADSSRSLSVCINHAWDRSHAASIFWMVEMMESWFHADKDALQKFYGSGFRRLSLKPNPNVEQIPKKDLESGLTAATKDTRKGDYYRHKTQHGPDLLTRIDPALVRGAAPNCQKLFETVLARLRE